MNGLDLYADAVQRNGALAQMLIAATRDDWPTHRVCYSPHEVPPGQEYKTDLVEIYGVAAGIMDARFCHPCVPLHPVWLANELAMFVDRGDPRLAALGYLSDAEARRFHALDDRGRIVRHYGYTTDDIKRIADLLAADPESKRVLFTFQEPAYLEPAAESPCAIATQYLLRNGRLWTISGFRSHDFFAGGRMDPMRISFVQQAVARLLNVAVGPMVIQEGSLHYYPTRKHAALEDSVARAEEMRKFGVIMADAPSQNRTSSYRNGAFVDFFSGCLPKDILSTIELFVRAFRYRETNTPVLSWRSPFLDRLVSLAVARANGIKVWA